MSRTLWLWFAGWRLSKVLVIIILILPSLADVRLCTCAFRWEILFVFGIWFRISAQIMVRARGVADAGNEAAMEF